MKLYKYSGTIEEFAVERGRISYIKLFDVTDFMMKGKAKPVISSPPIPRISTLLPLVFLVIPWNARWNMWT